MRTSSPAGRARATQVPAAQAFADAPRHHLPGARAATTVAVDVLVRVGSLVTLAAMLVLAATAGGVADGVPAGGRPTVTMTYEH